MMEDMDSSFRGMRCTALLADPFPIMRVAMTHGNSRSAAFRWWNPKGLVPQHAAAWSGGVANAGEWPLPCSFYFHDVEVQHMDARTGSSSRDIAPPIRQR